MSAEQNSATAFSSSSGVEPRARRRPFAWNEPRRSPGPALLFNR